MQNIILKIWFFVVFSTLFQNKTPKVDESGEEWCCPLHSGAACNCEPQTKLSTAPADNQGCVSRCGMRSESPLGKLTFYISNSSSVNLTLVLIKIYSSNSISFSNLYKLAF